MIEQRPNIKPACPHGVRWPWQCDDCDAADPMPPDYDPLAVDNDQVAFAMDAG